jgi:hypothetical protein
LAHFLVYRYWTASYAKAEDEDENAETVDQIELYGLDRQFVGHFVNMGFTQDHVVEVLRRLAIKKSNTQDSENRVLEELLKNS